MARSVDNIYFNVVVPDRSVLGQDGDSPLPLQVIGIHDPVPHLLVCTEYTALAQHLIHQCGFPVINVCYDCYISYVISCEHFISSFLKL